MSHVPFEHAESLRVGTVDFVSPDEIKVALDIEAPESVALNAGAPRPFPRVNSYVLVPVDDAYLVGQIGWLTVERSAFPKRRGMQDFGLIDLPYPLRKLSLSPLGTLHKKASKPGQPEAYSFRRGADALPSIGSAVLLPTDDQLRSIAESGERRRVKIGTSPLAGNAEVRIDPDRLFGRHLAVLGNTGSGKSCSVAGLIRWSLEQASEQSGKVPNARFVILDPNGEYSRAFADEKQPSKARVYRVAPDKEQREFLLQVPLWFWNSAEWCSFTQASSRTQRPTLIHALRTVRDGQSEPTKDAEHESRRYIRTVLTAARTERNAGNPWSGYGKEKNFRERLERWKLGFEQDLALLAGDKYTALKKVIDNIETLCAARRPQYSPSVFSRQEIDLLLDDMSAAHSLLGGSDADTVPSDVDAPTPFKGESLLRGVEATSELLGTSEHVETLLVRIRGILTNTIIRSIISDAGDVTLDGWLANYVGGELSDGCITIIDLSLVPTEIVHVVTSVVARIIFEALQRYRRKNQVALPTVLVMEEAHVFIRRYRDDAENFDTASMCCQVFERIAREGRKFGLGLVLSSQRPSELSPTVLSQCNSFLLHRINNDRDQELVQKLVPDNMKDMLRELPSLPSQNAILLGWASELPLFVKMNDLPKNQQPRSDDPDFWDVWIGRDLAGNEVARKADWKKITDDWQGQNKP
jgi:uncharacterized protein